MPVRTVPGFPELRYYLACFDKDGRERSDDPDSPDGKLTSGIVDALASNPVTDVFLMSHGWKGDVPAAIEQYDRWIGAMAQCEADRAGIRRMRPDFLALLVGLHWPSLPFGNEGISDAVSFAVAEGLSLDSLIDTYAQRIADTPAARAAMRTIFEAAMEDIAPVSMPAAVREAYAVLDRESGLGAAGVGAPPGADREPFDPERAYSDSQEDAASFGGFRLGGLLAPLQQLSFYVMKDRARMFGESGGHSLLRRMQQTARPTVRFHLMGHSFGCIVVSSILCGPGARSAPPRPVNTVFLVQGALSLWSFSSEIPEAPGTPGYFRALASPGRVDGPILITLSEHDYAVGRYYPIAAGLKRQVSFEPGSLPKYGAIGAFGARGSAISTFDLEMLPVSGTYSFEKGAFHNIDASEYIRKIEGASGAHSDIAHPEVGHAFWQAITA